MLLAKLLDRCHGFITVCLVEGIAHTAVLLQQNTIGVSLAGTPRRR
jgi:hypothetical protein